MRGALRRPTGDGVLEAMLELLAPALGSLPRFSAEIGSRTPPLSSPGSPRIPPGRPQKISGTPFLTSKNASEISCSLASKMPPKAVWLPKCSLASKMPPKASQNDAQIHTKMHDFSRCVFIPLFLQFWKVVFAFPGARPSISLLFTMNSWGAQFFAKSENVPNTSSNSQPK